MSFVPAIIFGRGGSSSGGGTSPSSILKPPSTTISIQNLLSHSYPDPQAGPLVFSAGTSSFINGVHSEVRVMDGSDVTFPLSDFPIQNISDYTTLKEPGTYQFIFWNIAVSSGVNKIGVRIIKSGADLTAPELSTATVEDATDNVMNLAFTEAVNITTAGWSLSTDNPTPLNINSVVGSGTGTPDFNLNRSVIEGEVITLDYDSSTGNTTDANGNPLADIVNFSVTNNVTNLIQLAAPTVNAPTMGSSSAALTWSAVTNNSGYDVYYKEQTSGTWIFFETTGIDTETSTVTGLDPATDYDFSVITKGDGVTYSDSVRSNIVQGTTSAAFNPVTEAYQFLDATILAGADASPVATLEDQSPNNRDASTVGAATPIIDERTINAQTIKTITLNDDQYAYDLGYNANAYANGDYEVWLAMEILLTTDTPTNPYINFEGARGPNTNDRYVIGFANGNPFSLVNNQVDVLKSTTYVAGISGFMSHRVFRYIFNYTAGTIDLYIDNVFIGSGDVTGYGANMAIGVNAYLGAENNNGVAAYRAGGIKTTMYLTSRALYNKILTTDEANEAFNYMSI